MTLLPDGDLSKPAVSDQEAINRIDNCFAMSGESVASEDWQRVKRLAEAALAAAKEEK